MHIIFLAYIVVQSFIKAKKWSEQKTARMCEKNSFENWFFDTETQTGHIILSCNYWGIKKFQWDHPNARNMLNINIINTDLL